MSPNSPPHGHQYAQEALPPLPTVHFYDIRQSLLEQVHLVSS
ncbi:MAG TPA: hypothetical protein VF043_09985 [Ktedonobacteraceae bacterium]